MKKTSFFLVAVPVLILTSFVAFADVAISTMTNVSFEKDGALYPKDMEYSVECYGYEDWSWQPDWEGDSEIGLVYSYTATCPSGECVIYEGYYMNYMDIEYCSLLATDEDGEEFFVENFGALPYGQCESLDQDYSMYDGENYYRMTDEYSQCLEDTDYALDECDQYMELVDKSELIFDNDGHVVEETCTTVFDLSSEGNPLPEQQEGPFSDVLEHGTSYYGAIQYVKDEGIVDGYPDGTYKPDNFINRAEFTKILTQASGLTAIYGDEIGGDPNLFNCFSDVKNEWFAPYVCTAKTEHVIDGYSDGTFKPANNINFVEAAKILVTAFSLVIEEDYGTEWYDPYVKALENQSAIPTSIDGYAELITRAEMAELIYRLKTGEQSEGGTHLPSLEW